MVAAREAGSHGWTEAARTSSVGFPSILTMECGSAQQLQPGIEATFVLPSISSPPFSRRMGEGYGGKFQTSDHGLVFLVSSSHPGAHQELPH